MKRLTVLFLALACIMLTACRYRGGKHIDISFNESGHYYRMEASFDKHRTRDVEIYMDRVLGEISNSSFVHTRINGQIALDDHTVFYIKKYPGYLRIKLDKNRNSYRSYLEMKGLCEGLKKVLTQ